MLLGSPENFSENGARPVQILGPKGRLIGWARSFSDFMTVTDNTIVGARPQGRLTRIAGRDVRPPDGHTVGKTFSRKELLECPWKPSPARSAESTSNHIPAPSQDRHQSVDSPQPWWHSLSGLQNGARETGLGQRLPGFLRSHQSFTPIDSLQPTVSSLQPAPHHAQKKLNKINEPS
jgi:hypothetical protein